MVDSPSDSTPERNDGGKGFHLPAEQVGRQAVNALRGYIYQIYQSLAAWLDLAEDETLLLEVAEDYAVVAARAFTATQVKDTASSGSITLRSNGQRRLKINKLLILGADRRNETGRKANAWYI